MNRRRLDHVARVDRLNTNGIRLDFLSPSIDREVLRPLLNHAYAKDNRTSQEVDPERHFVERPLDISLKESTQQADASGRDSTKAAASQ